MKIKLLTLLVIVITASTSCDKLNPISFYVKDETSIQVNSASLINTPFEIATPDITTNSTQEFENNNTNVSFITNVSLDELKLSITNPTGKTFSFLKNIHIYIATDETDEVELAFLDNVPPSDNMIMLNTTKVNLTKYIKASSYKLRTKVETRETMTQTTDIKVDLKFKVTAGR
jgi:hypothetical protein